MKVAKLEAEKSKLVQKILEKKIIENCEELAVCGKYTRLKKREMFANHEAWSYEDNTVSIKYESGISHYGLGAKLEVIEKETNTLVLELQEIEQRVSIKVKDDCFLTQYVPGDWENKVKEKLKELPETEVKHYKKYFPSMKLEEDSK
jgi:hypothetical protein